MFAYRLEFENGLLTMEPLFPRLGYDNRHFGGCLFFCPAK